MIVGDSGGFVNAAHREGSNLAMTTGRLAAETVIAAKAAGKPLTAKTLKAYKERLDESFVMKDLHKYRDLPQVLHDEPAVLHHLPRAGQPRGQDLLHRRRRRQEDQAARDPRQLQVGAPLARAGG